MSRRSVDLEVLRFRPDLEEEPAWEAYTVECDSEATLLDALRRLQAEVDSSLALRWSCRIGHCGACGVSVNGMPVLACRTRLAELPAPLRVAPLANFPVIRDLVVEVDGFETALREVRPWRAPSRMPQTEPGLVLDGPESACVECGLCYSVCPAVWSAEAFVGPAALARARLLRRDPTDVEREARQQVLASERGVWSCDEGGECSAACPYGVDPAAAATALKLDLVRHLGAAMRRRRP